MTLILYSTLGCHLCEQAQAVLDSFVNIEYEIVDIAEDDALVERYGIRIPVVKETFSERDIGWPFDQSLLAQWLSESEEYQDSR